VPQFKQQVDDDSQPKEEGQSAFRDAAAAAQPERLFPAREACVQTFYALSHEERVLIAS
jgi:hypothetical protein